MDLTKTITIIVVGVALLGIIGWDLVVNFNRIQGDTVSEILAATVRSAPIVAVVLGIILGHLVSQWKGIEPVLDWIAYRPIIAALYGLIGGFLFWNQNRSQ